MALSSFPPVIDARARVLILGSFPSAASLAAGQYYAHPQNHFWRILGAILAQPLADMAYAARLSALHDAGLALWDVYAACTREGSLDAAIRNSVPNDFAALRNSALALRRICFNGQAAGRFAPALAALGYETAILPSSSPANASWSFARKLEAWRSGLAHVGPVHDGCR